MSKTAGLYESKRGYIMAGKRMQRKGCRERECRLRKKNADERRCTG